MADRVIRLPATFPEIARAAAELRVALDPRGLDSKPRYNAELVFEEIVSNVIRHGCSNRAQCSIQISLSFREDSIVMHFQDDGPPFDPRGYELPVMPRSLEDSRHGGLGLLLVTKASQRIEYDWANLSNNLTVTIALAEAVSTATG